MKTTIQTILKQFWFVILVGFIFISFSIYYAWDTNKDKIPAKSSGGQDIIFSSNDYNYFADEYYEAIFNNESDDSTDGIAAIYTLFQNSVLEQVIETTDEMQESAEYSAEQYIAYYESTYGDYAYLIIESQLQQAGYSDYEDFALLFLNQDKYMQVIYDYVMANDDVYTQLFEDEEPRFVSQIYVSIDDMDEITEDEQTVMDNIDAALAEGDEFSKVAQLYSEDDTASYGGSLGIVLLSSGYDEAVLEEAYALEEGEVSSKWIETEDGYYKLYVESTDKDVILASDDVVYEVAAAAVTMNENIFNIALWDAATTLGLEFNDETIKEQLLAYMGIEEDE